MIKWKTCRFTGIYFAGIYFTGIYFSITAKIVFALYFDKINGFKKT